MTHYAQIPMQTVGPILINSPEFGHAAQNISVPLATYETPLWLSVNRGAKISQYAGGITGLVIKNHMTRSIALQAENAVIAHDILQQILADGPDYPVLNNVVSNTSRFAKLINITPEQIGNLLYLRLEYQTGDASGHNMTTLASEHIQNYLLTQYPALKYIAVSGNFCIDKKVSAVNSLLGRGKSVIAEITIPRKICQRFLKASPQQIAELHIKKNLIGSIAAGSLRSANAHYANMLLAFYLATGQDAANIVEGSQGITHAEVMGQDLYFSVNLPNLIVGTIGNGKELDFVQQNMKTLGLDNSNVNNTNPGDNSKKLAVICAATVLCGELSLMGAIANQGELIQSHIAIERKPNAKK